MPKSIKGWLAVIAWIALLLFVLMECSFEVQWDRSPTGPYGEPPVRYFHFNFRTRKIQNHEYVVEI